MKDLLEAVIEQIEMQTKTINRNHEQIIEMGEKVKFLPGKELTQEMNTQLKELTSSINTLNFPAAEIKKLSADIVQSTQLLKKIARKEVRHIHHVSSVIWIAIGLFLALTIASAGWYLTGRKLDGYIENDTKYRYLKLQKSKNLQYQLNLVDSLYQVNPDLRKQVLKQEEARERRLELLQQAREKQKEAEELRKKAEKVAK